MAERRAGDVERLGEGERGGAHGVAHGVLGRHDALEDGAELHGERVRLLLEQRVAAGGAGQPRLHHAQRRHRRHHVQALPLPRHPAALTPFRLAGSDHTLVLLELCCVVHRAHRAHVCVQAGLPEHRLIGSRQAWPRGVAMVQEKLKAMGSRPHGI